MVTLILFVVANYFYQAGLIFYDALLPVVSTPETRGRIGGIGIGVGYLRLVPRGRDRAAADLVGQPRRQAARLRGHGRRCSCCSRCRASCSSASRSASTPSRSAWQTVTAALGELSHTFGRVQQYPGLGRFLVGRIFYADAANTLIAFMGIYVTNEVGFTESQTQILLLGGIAAGVVGGPVWGPIVDRIGPKRTLDAVLVFWLVVFGLVAAIGGDCDPPGWLFWIAGPLVGRGAGRHLDRRPTADAPACAAALPGPVLRAVRDGRTVRGDPRAAALVDRGGLARARAGRWRC